MSATKLLALFSRVPPRSSPAPQQANAKVTKSRDEEPGYQERRRGCPVWMVWGKRSYRVSNCRACGPQQRRQGYRHGSGPNARKKSSACSNGPAMAYLRCNIVKQEIPHINAYVAHHVHVLNRVLQQGCSQQKTFKAKAREVKTTPIPVEMDLYYGVLAVQQRKGKHSVYYVAHHVETGDTSLNRCACNILIALKSSKDHRRIQRLASTRSSCKDPVQDRPRSSYTSPGSPQDLLLRTYARLCNWMPAQQDLLKMLRSTKYCACHKTWIRGKLGPTFCASLARSRNAYGHLRRARLCDTMRMLQTKIGAHTLREPA